MIRRLEQRRRQREQGGKRAKAGSSQTTRRTSRQPVCPRANGSVPCDCGHGHWRSAADSQRLDDTGVSSRISAAFAFPPFSSTRPLLVVVGVYCWRNLTISCLRFVQGRSIACPPEIPRMRANCRPNASTRQKIGLDRRSCGSGGAARDGSHPRHAPAAGRRRFSGGRRRLLRRHGRRPAACRQRGARPQHLADVDGRQRGVLGLSGTPQLRQLRSAQGPRQPQPFEAFRHLRRHERTRLQTVRPARRIRALARCRGRQRRSVFRLRLWRGVSARGVRAHLRPRLGHRRPAALPQSGLRRRRAPALGRAALLRRSRLSTATPR